MNLLTPRLELIPATFELIHADLKGCSHLARLLGVRAPGDWPPPLTHFTVMLWFKQQLKKSPQWTGWFPWYWIGRTERLLIGWGGFKGVPTDDGTVEIGYSVVRGFQRRGYATEAVAALTGWAFSHAQVRRIMAEAHPQRTTSRRVLEKIGFKQLEGASEDGSFRFELRRETTSMSG